MPARVGLPPGARRRARVDAARVLPLPDPPAPALPLRRLAGGGRLAPPEVRGHRRPDRVRRRHGLAGRVLGRPPSPRREPRPDEPRPPAQALSRRAELHGRRRRAAGARAVLLPSLARGRRNGAAPASGTTRRRRLPSARRAAAGRGARGAEPHATAPARAADSRDRAPAGGRDRRRAAPDLHRDAVLQQRAHARGAGAPDARDGSAPARHRRRAQRARRGAQGGDRSRAPAGRERRDAARGRRRDRPRARLLLPAPRGRRRRGRRAHVHPLQAHAGRRRAPHHRIREPHQPQHGDRQRAARLVGSAGDGPRAPAAHPSRAREPARRARGDPQARRRARPRAHGRPRRPPRCVRGAGGPSPPAARDRLARAEGRAVGDRPAVATVRFRRPRDAGRRRRVADAAES